MIWDLNNFILEKEDLLNQSEFCKLHIGHYIRAILKIPESIIMDTNHPPMKASQILLTIAAFVIVVAGMRAAVDILVPFLLAAFIAIISGAPLFWLQRKGLPAWLALLIIISSIFFIGFLMAWLVGSSVKDFLLAASILAIRI